MFLFARLLAFINIAVVVIVNIPATCLTTYV